MSLKKCFGIISYFPGEQPGRKQRQDRLDRLIKQLGELGPDIPILIISQQGQYYDPTTWCKNKIIRFDYPKLGILNARQKLRKHFLKSDFEYIIMFDDDAIIEGEKPEDITGYMDAIDSHPNGFCFIEGKGSSPFTNYADSQLNLCAISKYIYKKEPLPYINPQESEGFEDRIGSTLLHFKYADLEFKVPSGIKCAHFKNPDINKYGGEVPSTGSREKPYDWEKLRAQTLENEKYIAQHKELPSSLRYYDENSDPDLTPKIDIVVTYVDSSIAQWQEGYQKQRDIELKNNTLMTSDQMSGKCRFRQGDNFKYGFRGVENNIPGINKVFLIVQDETQVPDGLNINHPRLKIIYHKDYIPEEFLPTFNSNVIEMFLYLIPELSDLYLLSNDDIFFINYTPKSFFYDKNSIVKDKSMIGYQYDRGEFGRTLENNHNLLVKNKLINQKYTYVHPHVIEIHQKSLEEELMLKNYDKIHDAFTHSHFRYITDYTNGFFSDALKSSGKVIANNSIYKKSVLLNINSSGSFDAKKYENYQMICFNDIPSTDFEKAKLNVNSFLERKLPEKSSFEK